MTNIQFFAVVAKMRQAQQKYFSLPHMHPEKGVWLNESKHLEKLVDREIARVVPMVDADELRDAYKPYDPKAITQQKLPL